MKKLERLNSAEEELSDTRINFMVKFGSETSASPTSQDLPMIMEIEWYNSLCQLSTNYKYNHPINNHSNLIPLATPPNPFP